MKWLWILLIPTFLWAQESPTSKPAEKKYDTKIRRVEQRMSRLEAGGNNLTISWFQPSTKVTGVQWYNPVNKELRTFITNEWRKVFFEDDALALASLPDSIPVTLISDGEIDSMEFGYLNGLAGNVQDQIGARWDSVTVAAKFITRQPYTDTSSWDATKTDLLVLQSDSDTSSWDATRSWCTGWLDTSKVVFWADSANELATNYDVSLKLNSAAIDTSKVVFWADSVNELATNYDVSLKLNSAAIDTSKVVFWADSANELATKTNINRRYVYFFFDTATETGSTFIYDAGGTKSAATRGYPAIRAGSITGVSIQANVSAYTNSGTITADVWVNGSSVFQVATAAVTGTGLIQAQGTQAAGTDAVAAGNIIAAKALWTATFSVNYISMTIEFESTN